MSKGYYGIGVFHSKTEDNIGKLWRSAFLYNAAFVFTIGRRYKKQSMDTTKTYRHIPIWHFNDYEEFSQKIPMECRLVNIELSSNSTSLPKFHHPKQAIYLLGAEDYGIPAKILEKGQVVQIPTCKNISMNVAVAGSIVMYDRYIKQL